MPHDTASVTGRLYLNTAPSGTTYLPESIVKNDLLRFRANFMLFVTLKSTKKATIPRAASPAFDSPTLTEHATMQAPYFAEACVGIEGDPCGQ